MLSSAHHPSCVLMKSTKDHMQLTAFLGQTCDFFLSNRSEIVGFRSEFLLPISRSNVEQIPVLDGITEDALLILNPLC